MMFILFKYFLFLLMIIYDIFVVYVASPFSPRGWAGIGNTTIIVYATLPIFIVGAVSLEYFLRKNENMNAVIPAVTCMAVVLLFLYLFIKP